MTKPVANRFAAQGWARVPGFLEQGLCGLVYAHALRQSELGRDYSNQAAGFEWPLYMGGTPVETPPGTALLYKGMELEHWREPLKGRSQMQLFLHYVDQQGEWAECCKFDGRPWLGAPAGVKLPHLQERLMRKMRGG